LELKTRIIKVKMRFSSFFNKLKMPYCCEKNSPYEGNGQESNGGKYSREEKAVTN